LDVLLNCSDLRFFRVLQSSVYKSGRLVAGLGLSLALAGCGSFFSAAGPTKGSITTLPETGEPNYSLIKLSPETITPYMRPPEAALMSEVSGIVASDVSLMPGDVLSVVVSDSASNGALFAPLATGGTTFPKVRLDSTGHITLPYVGKIALNGASLQSAADSITQKLKGVVADPQVQVDLVGDVSGSVLVAGAVKTPGRFSALQGPLTLLDAINLAGGPVLEPHLVRVVLRTGNSVNTWGYEELLAGKNRAIPPRSEIIVERNRKRFVAMGAVGNPGLLDLPSENPSLLEVLGTVGGLNERVADARGVFVFRLIDDDKTKEPVAQVFQLDMREPVSIFLARKFLVLPEDAIYVTNAHSYEFQKLIAPIVQTLLLGRTVGNM
jgi:polysaccharide export outer membrane protein